FSRVVEGSPAPTVSSRPKWRDRAPSAARGHRGREHTRKFHPRDASWRIDSGSYIAACGGKTKSRCRSERAVVAARERATIPPLRQPPVGMTQTGAPRRRRDEDRVLPERAVVA